MSGADTWAGLTPPEPPTERELARERKERSLSRLTKTQRERVLKREWNEEKAFYLEVPFLTRLNALRALQNDFFNGQPYSFWQQVFPSLTKDKFTRYIKRGEGPVLKSLDYEINKACAEWLQSLGIYTGAATEFLDLMDLDRAETALKAVLETIPKARKRGSEAEREYKDLERKASDIDADWVEKIYEDGDE